MFKNLLKIALRNIVKEKMYSAVNILGLSVGITCSLFLLMYILDELSYDRYNVNAENIYRVISDVKEPDNAFLWSVTQGPLAEELRENYPEIRNAVQFRSTNKMLYKNGEKQFLESDFYQADSTVFEMFSYSFIEGDSRTALDEPNCIDGKDCDQIFWYSSGCIRSITGECTQCSNQSNWRYQGCTIQFTLQV
ncbi:MAG: ABC transporter permease [Chryseolinea sp.]